MFTDFIQMLEIFLGSFGNVSNRDLNQTSKNDVYKNNTGNQFQNIVIRNLIFFSYFIFENGHFPDFFPDIFYLIAQYWTSVTLGRG